MSNHNTLRRHIREEANICNWLVLAYNCDDLFVDLTTHPSRLPAALLPWLLGNYEILCGIHIRDRDVTGFACSASLYDNVSVRISGLFIHMRLLPSLEQGLAAALDPQLGAFGVGLGLLDLDAGDARISSQPEALC